MAGPDASPGPCSCCSSFRSTPFNTASTAPISSGGTAAALLPIRGSGERRKSGVLPIKEQYLPSLAWIIVLPVLLLGIAGVSVAPLAGPRTGWAYFYREHMHSQYLSDLTLDDWTHYIKVGYYRHTNAIREYAWRHHWDVNGPVGLYGMLWDNFQYGDAAQLVGGYAAGALVISAASALAYFGLWLRCVLQIRQPQGGDPEAATAGGAQVPQKSKRHLYRPLGPYLWPIALTNSVLLGVLVITFLLVVIASFRYQTVHGSPGVECELAPSWAWWCAMSAVFAWLCVTILASIEACRQGKFEMAAPAAAPGRLQPPSSAMPPRSRSGGGDSLTRGTSLQSSA